MYEIRFGLRTLSESSSFIWALDHSNRSSWKKVTCAHSLNFWYFYDVFWKNFSIQTSISPVLINVWCSFWSKNTQWIKLFHLSYGSLKSVKLKKNYERTFAEFLVLLRCFLKKFLHSNLYISSSNWYVVFVLV